MVLQIKTKSFSNQKTLGFIKVGISGVQKFHFNDVQQECNLACGQK